MNDTSSGSSHPMDFLLDEELNFPVAGEVRSGKWLDPDSRSQGTPKPPTQGICWVKVLHAKEGQAVEYDVQDGPKGPQASKIMPAESAA